MTVLDAFGWAMTAAPYVPAVVIPSVLAAVVYAAWHTTLARRVTEADRRLGDRLHRRPNRPGPDEQLRQPLEQLYQMPAWEDETR